MNFPSITTQWSVFKTNYREYQTILLTFKNLITFRVIIPYCYCVNIKVLLHGMLNK